jgi:hypothetical protein
MSGAGGRLLLHHRDERELRTRRCPRARGGHPQGHVPAARGRKKRSKARVQLLGSGTILREVIAAPSCSKNDFGVAADVWSVTELQRAARDGIERRALEPAASDARAARKSYVERCLEGRREGPGDRRDRLHAPSPTRSGRSCRAATYTLGTDGFGRSDYARKLRQLLRGRTALRRGRGAEGARRRGRGSSQSRRRGDQEIRHRPSGRIPGPCEKAGAKDAAPRIATAQRGAT